MVQTRNQRLMQSHSALVLERSVQMASRLDKARPGHPEECLQKSFRKSARHWKQDSRSQRVEGPGQDPRRRDQAMVLARSDSLRSRWMCRFQKCQSLTSNSHSF
jgi:hypothetical protein